MNRHDPSDLAAKLLEVAQDLKAHGDLAQTKSHDWTFGPRKVDMAGERGGGLAEAQPEDRANETLEDRRAAKVHGRYLHALEALRQAAIDVDVLHKVILPGQPRHLHHSDMTAVQLIADGWCPSCFRDNRHLAPLAAGRYSDRCRPCGEHRAREGQDPPMDALRIIHTKGKALRQRILTAVKGA